MGRITTTFEIEDSGCGISEEFQKRIFDPFSQEHNAVSKGMQGTGLGMSISTSLAKQMGGSLAVRSKLGEGKPLYLYADHGDRRCRTGPIAP